MSSWFVYFMRPIGQEGPVKIGFSKLPEARLATYQAWSPWPLEVVAKLHVPTDNIERKWAARSHVQAVERRFHERYFPWHSHHEWFVFNSLLAADIEAIRAGTFDLALLPAPTMATWRLPMQVAA